jgi:hypothetical protein
MYVFRESGEAIYKLSHGMSSVNCFQSALSCSPTTLQSIAGLDLDGIARVVLRWIPGTRMTRETDPRTFSQRSKDQAWEQTHFGRSADSDNSAVRHRCITDRDPDLSE